MEKKKLLVGLTTAAVVANMALAGLAMAGTSSDDTMTVNMNAGSLSLVTPGSLTLGDAANSCSGALDASVNNQTVCAAPGTIEMDDLRSSTSDVSVTVDFEDFAGGSYSQTISAASTASIDSNFDSSSPAVTFSGEIGASDFDAVTANDFGPSGTQFTPGTPQTLYNFDKPASTYVLFEAQDMFQVSVVVPGGTPADTYTNTVAFVIQ